jgi:hypothetical protein
LMDSGFAVRDSADSMLSTGSVTGPASGVHQLSHRLSMP